MIQVKTKKGKVDCRIADTPLKKIIGLMLRRKIFPLFFECRQESRYGCAIHTFFMLRTIDVIFLNAQKNVVDKRTAKPFLSCVKPKEPAKYVIELPEGNGKLFEVGEVVKFA